MSRIIDETIAHNQRLQNELRVANRVIAELHATIDVIRDTTVTDPANQLTLMKINRMCTARHFV